MYDMYVILNLDLLNLLATSIVLWHVERKLKLMFVFAFVNNSHALEYFTSQMIYKTGTIFSNNVKYVMFNVFQLNKEYSYPWYKYIT